MNKITLFLEDKEYQIDIQKAKELGLLKEKDTRCKSWKEYCKKYQSQKGYYFLREHCCIKKSINPTATVDQLTKEEAIAISAFSKLLKLRRDWIGDWEPNWNDSIVKYCIEIYKSEFQITSYCNYSKTFSFPTKEMAEEFLNCFRDLFEDCKYLI